MATDGNLRMPQEAEDDSVAFFMKDTSAAAAPAPGRDDDHGADEATTSESRQHGDDRDAPQELTPADVRALRRAHMRDAASYKLPDIYYKLLLWGEHINIFNYADEAGAQQASHSLFSPLSTSLRSERQPQPVPQ